MTDRNPLPRARAVLLAGGLAAAVAIAGMADAGQRDGKIAARNAERATKALAQHDAGSAVAFAEQAVSISPQDAGYRLVLGQSYLADGRFASARAALADAMTLAPANGKIALNLALASIATGDWQAARQVLASHRTMIQPTDLGLATALAGDPASGVAILTAAVRAPDATVKTRQNLALAYALAGQWSMARIVAATDLSPADLDRRMQDWALFAQPRGASDQVAMLLGVKPITDPGQPVALALAAPVAVALPAAAPSPAIAPGVAVVSAPATATIVTPAIAVPSPVPVVAAPAPIVVPIAPTPAAPRVAPVAAPVVAVRAASDAATGNAPVAASAGFSHVVFGPPLPVVQPLPVATIQADAVPARVAVAKTAAPAGRWYVQLGAFSSAGNAHAAWNRVSHRLSKLSGFEPHGASVAVKGGTLYRLSVGGFDRGGADQLCRRYRAAGGVCFVRAGAGDQLASWVNRKTQLASR